MIDRVIGDYIVGRSPSINTIIGIVMGNVVMNVENKKSIFCTAYD